jgi:hypothetical protein
MKIGILLLASATLLCGCSSTPARWTKFGYSHQQFEADWGECQKQESPKPCMIAKGYTEDNQ